MTVIDALEAPAAKADENLYGDYRVGDYVRISGEIGQYFRIMRFDRFEDSPDEVLTYGGSRKDYEWGYASFRSFTCDRITRVCKAKVTDHGTLVRG